MKNYRGTWLWAKKKERKRIARKDKRYKPNSYFIYGRKKLIAPKIFSILDNRNATINFFNSVLDHTRHKKFIEVDLSKISFADAPTISIVIAMMMDKGKGLYEYAVVTIPSKNTKTSEIFKRCDFHQTVTIGNSDRNHFMSRTDSRVNQEYTKEIINFSKSKGAIDSEKALNPFLVEICSNTNNHASPDASTSKIPWFISVIEDQGKLCFTVVDLGIGIYDSLQTNGALVNLPKAEFNVIKDMYKNEQTKYLSSQIPIGLYSSTKIKSRGKGLRRIYEKAKSSTKCKKFVIISNKAIIDMKNISKIQHDSDESFCGTVVYWEMEK